MMRDVAIVGVGSTPVGEHWDRSLRMLAADAIQDALQNVNIASVDALYVGNAYGASFSNQSQLGGLLADYAGLGNIEAYTIEAAEASGAAALRAAYLAVASGAVETALVVGVEKSTDSIAGARVKARSISLDADYEAIHGATVTAMSAMLMRRYMYEYGVPLDAFEGFSMNAHRNGSTNAHAMFQNVLKPGAYVKASMVSDPVNLFDGAADADGAAAVILTSAERAADLNHSPVIIAGSGVATDTFALQDRENMLYLKAADMSAVRAYERANITTADVDFIELHDAFSILAVLSLEASGFALPGEGWKLAANGGEAIARQGSLPISTFGGLKSRGNPVGATGIYQAVEAFLQLTGQAGKNQVENAKIGVIQSLGGIGTTAITHVLRASS